MGAEQKKNFFKNHPSEKANFKKHLLVQGKISFKWSDDQQQKKRLFQYFQTRGSIDSFLK